jgi:hypothetical protein
MPFLQQGKSRYSRIPFLDKIKQLQYKNIVTWNRKWGCGRINKDKTTNSCFLYIILKIFKLKLSKKPQKIIK